MSVNEWNWGESTRGSLTHFIFDVKLLVYGFSLLPLYFRLHIKLESLERKKCLILGSEGSVKNETVFGHPSELELSIQTSFSYVGLRLVFSLSVYFKEKGLATGKKIEVCRIWKDATVCEMLTGWSTM